MSYLIAFKEKIAQNDYPGFLKLWEEYCFSDSPNGEELISILKLAKESELAAAFGKHVQRGLSLWEAVKEPPLKDEILKLIVDIQNSNDYELAEIVYKYLEEKYKGDNAFDTKIRMIGLRNRENFQGAISGYELLSHINKGKFVFHKAGWGTGKVLDFSLVREELTVEFEFLTEKKTLSFENALKTLIPIGEDHFLTRRFGDPDLLEREAKENPAAIIHILLRDLGSKNAAEIKDELIDLVIPEKDWNKWWQSTRQKIKKDPEIEYPHDISDPFVLRKMAIQHEDTLLKEIDQTKSAKETIEAIYNFLRDFPETLKKETFKSSLLLKISSLLSQPLSEAERISIEFIQEDISKKTSSKELIQNSPSIENLVNEIDILAFKKRILTMVKKLKSNWEDIFLNLILSIEQNLIRDYLFKELEKSSPDKLKNRIQELIKSPKTYPTATIWYFKKLTDGENIFFSDDRGKCLFFEAFLILLDHLKESQREQETVKKMVNLLIHNKFKVMRDIFKIASLEETKEFLLLIPKSHSFNECDIKIVNSLAEVAHSEIKRKEKKEEDYVWTTEEGYKIAREKLKIIATKDIIENAREIEEARSHGDLRENAEYKAALEKRARLQGEMQFLSSQFEKVRIIVPAEVSTAFVGIGTVVNCENGKGKKESFTILGPWEAVAEKNIVSYNSKLALSMKNKKVGDKFTFKDEEFTIKSIASYFES